MQIRYAVVVACPGFGADGARGGSQSDMEIVVLSFAHVFTVCVLVMVMRSVATLMRQMRNLSKMCVVLTQIAQKHDKELENITGAVCRMSVHLMRNAALTCGLQRTVRQVVEHVVASDDEQPQQPQPPDYTSDGEVEAETKAPLLQRRPRTRAQAAARFAI